MLKSTPGQIESVLRKYSSQLKGQKKLSANEVTTLARLTSSFYRLQRPIAGRATGMSDEEYSNKFGDSEFYQSLTDE